MAPGTLHSNMYSRNDAVLVDAAGPVIEQIVALRCAGHNSFVGHNSNTMTVRMCRGGRSEEEA